jgi:exodeoxyribonuclease VII small subunit
MSDGVPKSFEEKLERIDAIVKELESGRVELDRAIELFKEGKVLARECETMLRSAQEQVDKAMADTPGA